MRTLHVILAFGWTIAALINLESAVGMPRGAFWYFILTGVCIGMGLRNAVLAGRQ